MTHLKRAREVVDSCAKGSEQQEGLPTPAGSKKRTTSSPLGQETGKKKREATNEKERTAKDDRDGGNNPWVEVRKSPKKTDEKKENPAGDRHPVTNQDNKSGANEGVPKARREVITIKSGRNTSYAEIL